jgi:DeoR/GlpR family transcriptional regulator of sugar metabolism
MQTQVRRDRLVEIIRLSGFASLFNLAKEVKVSESTVRRDLDYLEETGVAKRTHGGVFYTGPSPKSPHFDRRQNQRWEQKKQIARAAADLIQDGETVLLDGGSTTYELAQQLVGRPLQVVTNSFPVAMLFMTSDAADLVFIGGYVHGKTGVCIGPYARDAIESLNVERALLSVAGINEKGFYNSNLLLVETERAMMESADEVVILADTTKFDRSSLAQLCPLGEVDTLVADDQLPESWQERVTQAGIQLVIAPGE